MSSHHIVREDQEPALLIANAHAIEFEKIQELLEWMPTVIVMADQVETVIAWGIKVDVVIVPIAEAEMWSVNLTDQNPIRLVTYNPMEDALLTALNFLRTSKSTAVNCLFNSKEDLIKIEPFKTLDVDVFFDGTRWAWIKKGHFEKWLPAGTTLSLLPDERKKDFVEFNSGVYVIKKDGIVLLNCSHPFWVGELL
jgi:thiamine pyrophosphokinase